MTQWHAAIDKPLLGTGAKLTVISDHHVVRVTTADTLSIEAPDGQRFSAQVLDRTAQNMRLALEDGTALRLEIVVDESLHAPSGRQAEVFSRQVWLAN